MILYQHCILPIQVDFEVQLEICQVVTIFPILITSLHFLVSS